MKENIHTQENVPPKHDNQSKKQQQGNINHTEKYTAYVNSKTSTEKLWKAYDLSWNSFVSKITKGMVSEINANTIPWPIDFYTFLYF
jgi:hypothetical protein